MEKRASQTSCTIPTEDLMKSYIMWYSLASWFHIFYFQWPPGVMDFKSQFLKTCGPTIKYNYIKKISWANILYNNWKSISVEVFEGHWHSDCFSQSVRADMGPMFFLLANSGPGYTNSILSTNRLWILAYLCLLSYIGDVERILFIVVSGAFIACKATI